MRLRDMGKGWMQGKEPKAGWFPRQGPLTRQTPFSHVTRKGAPNHVTRKRAKPKRVIHDINNES